MRENDTLGITGAPRGELEKGDVVLYDRRKMEFSLVGFELAHACDFLQTRHLRSKQKGEGPHLWKGNENSDLGGAEYPSLTSEVILDLATAGRGVERHRDAARDLNAVESRKVIETRGEHQTDCVPALEPETLQPHRHAPRPPSEGPIREAGRRALGLFEGYVDAVGMLFDVPVEYFYQSPSALGCRRGVTGLLDASSTERRHPSFGRDSFRQIGQQIPRGLGGS